MLLCLDVGNSHIFGGVFSKDNTLLLSFRHETNVTATSDQLGVFLKSVLRENGVDTNNNSDDIKHIAVSSVVPSIDYSLRAACKKYFNIDPFFLHAENAVGLTIKTLNPSELGADLIAGAIAAINHFPQRNIIVVDLGTATTFAAINAAAEFLGVSIMAGMRLTVSALSSNTAKLFSVAIAHPEHALGRATKEALQSGLYYGHLGAIKEIATQMTKEAFGIKFDLSAKAQNPILLGTGGFSHLFEGAQIFAAIKPNLVLDGLRLAYEKTKRRKQS